MIKSTEYVNISLDTILNEILKLSYSVGECKSSVDHIEDAVIRSHLDIRESINDVNKRLSNIEGREEAKQSRSNFLINFFQLNFSNLLKWVSCLMILGIVLGNFVKADLFKFIDRVQHYIVQQE